MVTDPGTTVGTIDYMSPEQARGDPNLTPQSDQFSFGLVLYELASGKRAFHRASAPETMVAIIREDAEPLPASVPAPLRWLIERLLAKDPAERYDSTRDLYRELKQIRDRLSQATSDGPGGCAAGKESQARAACGAGRVCGHPRIDRHRVPRSERPPVDLSTYKFTPLAPGRIDERESAWSPDSKSIAYTAMIHGKLSDLHARASARRMTRRSPARAKVAWHLFWSPDGQLIYYSSGGDLWSVPAAGGTARLVLEKADPASIHPDGKTLAFVRDGKMWITSLNGGPPKEFWPGPIGAIGDVTISRFSPDGSNLAVLREPGPLGVAISLRQASKASNRRDTNLWRGLVSG